MVVDSGSTDDTLQIAKHFSCKVIHYPANRPFNYSSSLNLGITHCAGEKILIVSSHCVMMYNDVVRVMAENLNRSLASGVYCMVTPPMLKQFKRNDPLRGKLTTLIYRDNFDGSNGLFNYCSMIDRRCWLEHPFDESMPTAEDQEWAFWHYNNTGRPTVCIRNAGVMYMNPYHSMEKEIRERVVVATRILPSLRSWPAIFSWVQDAFFAVLNRRLGQFRKCSKMAWRLALSRISKKEYPSKYF